MSRKYEQDAPGVGPEVWWILGCWILTILAAVLCFSCKGTDAKPDELTVTYGHSEGGIDGYRHDMDADYGEFGLVWYIGEPARPPWSPPAEPAPIQEPEAQPEPEHAASEAPKPDEPIHWKPMIPGLALMLVAAFLKVKDAKIA